MFSLVSLRSLIENLTIHEKTFIALRELRILCLTSFRRQVHLPPGSHKENKLEIKEENDFKIRLLVKYVFFFIVVDY